MKNVVKIFPFLVNKSMDKNCEQTLVMLWMLDGVGWNRLVYLKQYAHPANIVTTETTTTTVNQSPVSVDTEITRKRNCRQRVKN